MKSPLCIAAVTICLFTACAPSQRPSNSTTAQPSLTELETRAKVAEIKLRASQEKMLDLIQARRKKAMDSLQSARRGDRVDDSAWMNVQVTDRNIVDGIGNAHSASTRGDTNEFLRLQSYLLDQVAELEGVAKKYSK